MYQRDEAVAVPKRMEGQQNTKGIWRVGRQSMRLDKAQGKAEETAKWLGETRQMCLNGIL